jgi:hypothetical protein
LAEEMLQEGIDLLPLQRHRDAMGSVLIDPDPHRRAVLAEPVGQTARLVNHTAAFILFPVQDKGMGADLVGIA